MSASEVVHSSLTTVSSRSQSAEPLNRLTQVQATTQTVVAPTGDSWGSNIPSTRTGERIASISHTVTTQKRRTLSKQEWHLGLAKVVRTKRAFTPNHHGAFSDEDRNTETEVLLTPWFIQWALSITIKHIFGKPNIGVKPIRVQSDESAYWMACQLGTCEELMKLFRLGQASPYDIDEWGRTGFAWAVGSLRADVCNFFLKCLPSDAEGFFDEYVIWELQHVIGDSTFSSHEKYKDNSSAMHEDYMTILRLMMAHFDVSRDLIGRLPKTGQNGG